MSVAPPLVGGIDLYVLRGDGSTLVLISSCCQHSMVPRTCTPRWWRLLFSILYVQKKLAETRLCVHRPNFTSGTGVIRLFFLFTNRCNHGFVRFNGRTSRGAKLLRGLLCSKPDASVSFSFAVLHMYLVPPLRLATAFHGSSLPQPSAPRESGSQVKARSVLDHPRTCRGEAQAPTQVDVCKQAQTL